MIKYYTNEEKKQIVAVLNGTRFDVIKKINKIVDSGNFAYYYNEKCLMPHSFRVVVTCDPADEFDVETGKKIAKKRIMERYYRSFDKRVEYFMKDINSMCSKFSKYNKKSA